MSAYIVDYKTMNRILSFLNKQRMKGKTYSYLGQDLTQLGRKLLQMNVKAVSQRYPSDTDSTRPGLRENASSTAFVKAYSFEPADVSDVQAWSSAHCFHYQCSEGTVPKSKPFKLFEKFLADLSYNIIHDLPQAQSVEWG